jgi:hypothetical protein
MQMRQVGGLSLSLNPLSLISILSYLNPLVLSHTRSPASALLTASVLLLQTVHLQTSGGKEVVTTRLYRRVA